jgi:hypothetical protein
VLRQVQAMLALLEEPFIDEDGSAYCQARQILPAHLLEAVFQASFRSAEQKAPPSTLLQGRPVKVVDASTVRLEDTPKNRAAYPASPNQFSRPGFPTPRSADNEDWTPLPGLAGQVVLPFSETNHGPGG